MALLGIQLVAVLFAAGIFYLSYVHYRRREFSLGDFVLWIAAVAGLVLFALFPQSFTPLVQSLALFDTMQLVMIVGMAFLTTLVFFLYYAVRKDQRKLANLVTSLAIAEGKRKR